MHKAFAQRIDDLSGLQSVQPGTRICYYRGDMAIARAEGGDGLNCNEVVALANFARKLFLSGHCTLTQKRHGDHDYEYVAIAVSPRHKPVLGGPQTLRYGR